MKNKNQSFKLIPRFKEYRPKREVRYPYFPKPDKAYRPAPPGSRGNNKITEEDSDGIDLEIVIRATRDSTTTIRFKYGEDELASLHDFIQEVEQAIRCKENFIECGNNYVRIDNIVTVKEIIK